jgi:hypothetical protein
MLVGPMQATFWVLPVSGLFFCEKTLPAGKIPPAVHLSIIRPFRGFVAELASKSASGRSFSEPASKIFYYRSYFLLTSPIESL